MLMFALKVKCSDEQEGCPSRRQDRSTKMDQQLRYSLFMRCPCSSMCVSLCVHTLKNDLDKAINKINIIKF